MNIIFMGTPDFAVKSLEALIRSKHKISAVFSQADKPVGRKKILSSPPVKICAEANDITVYQPESLRSETIQNVIRNLAPDIIVVVAYGKILPELILKIPRLGCLNIHASLLPKYRGAAPIQWSIINGESKTGVTSMFMDRGLDTGDILLKSTTEIELTDEFNDLWERLSHMGADLLLKTLDQLEQSKIKPEKQDESQATYAPMLNKELARIDFNRSAMDFHNMVRALNHWPVVSVDFKGKTLKIYKTEISSLKGKTPGIILSINPLVVSCLDGSSIQIKEVQLEGKKRMCAETFVLGARLKQGDIF